MKGVLVLVGLILIAMMTFAVSADTCSVCNETCSPCGGGCDATDLSSMYELSYYNTTNFDVVVGDISGWNTSCIIDMNRMFRDAPDFNQDISGWNTSSVTSMYMMFAGATQFNQNLSAWDMTNVDTMDGMFHGATAFNGDVSGWDISNYDYHLNGLFKNAPAFNQDISGWDVDQVYSFSEMFSGATNFNQDISGWNTGSVTDMYNMFYQATSFDQDLSYWDVSNVNGGNDFGDMFGEDNLSTSNYDAILIGWANRGVFPDKEINFGYSQYTSAGEVGREILEDDYGWIITDGGLTTPLTENETCSVCNETCSPCGGGCTATDMSGMYMGVTDFDNVVGDITGWNTSCITSMTSMLRGTDFNQDISGWDTSSVTDMSGMFIDTPTFNQPIGSWDVGQVTDMNAMFAGATSFNQNLSNWNTISVTTMGNMFNGDTDFNGNITNWNTGQVTNMGNMFKNSNFNQDISGWDTSQVTNMAGMFQGSVYNQPIGSWNTSQVTDMNYMFNNDRVFNQDISGWDTSHVTSMRGIFSGDWAFDQPIGSWNTSSVTDMYGMFIASNFNQDISGWDTSQVTDMGGTFALSNFNKDISSWDIGNVLSMFNMFNMVTLSTENYDSILLGWSNQSVQDNVTFNAGYSQYSSAGLVGRNILTDFYGWIITDGGQLLTYPTDPTDFLNRAGGWGYFPSSYDKEIFWNGSTTNASTISYECRMDYINQSVTCGNFSPFSDVTYDIQYSDDGGANWYMPNGSYNYTNYGMLTDNDTWGWKNPVVMFKTGEFPEGNLTLRVRAFDGTNYSNWVESDVIENKIPYWECSNYNATDCLGDHFYYCNQATDTHSDYGTITWDWNFYYPLADLHNRTACGMCTPNWNCTGYTDCATDNSQTCNVVTDESFCNVSYAGNYSEFGTFVCDYCTPDWSCSAFGACVLHHSNCLSVNDTNNCYAETNLSSDQFDGNLTPYGGGCGYAPNYVTGDITGMATDVIGNGLLEVVAFIGVIVVVGIVIYGANRLKKLGRR